MVVECGMYKTHKYLITYRFALVIFEKYGNHKRMLKLVYHISFRATEINSVANCFASGTKHITDLLLEEIVCNNGSRQKLQGKLADSGKLCFKVIVN